MTIVVYEEHLTSVLFTTLSYLYTNILQTKPTVLVAMEKRYARVHVDKQIYKHQLAQKYCFIGSISHLTSWHQLAQHMHTLEVVLVAGTATLWYMVTDCLPPLHSIWNMIE